MVIDPPSSVSGAILAGGASRRMGSDKALMTLGGRTLLERAIGAVQAVADDVTIVGDRPDYHDIGVPVVRDDFPGMGPLGGIATALRVARHECLLVVGCDMPFLSVPLLTAMAREPRDYDALVPVTVAERGTDAGRPTRHTLHAFYARQCRAVAIECLGSGRLSVAEMTARVRTRDVFADWMRRFDPELRSLRNVNDRAQLTQAARELDDHGRDD